MAERRARAGEGCPACGQGLLVVRRGGARGPFLGCSTFPDCRAIRQLDGTRFPGWDRPGLSARPPSPRRARRVLVLVALLILAAVVACRVLVEVLAR
jgi:ssDNA-binding Zn-finger/Zn-ribbon topoisomerase 1